MGLIDLGWSPMDGLKKVFQAPKIDVGFSPMDGVKNAGSFGMYGGMKEQNNQMAELKGQLAELQGQLADAKGATPGATPGTTVVSGPVKGSFFERMGGPLREGVVENAGSVGSEAGHPEADGKPGELGKVLIEEGQTLSGIAADKGLTVEQMMEMNPELTDPDQISAGAELNLVPGVDEPVADQPIEPVQMGASAAGPEVGV